MKSAVKARERRVARRLEARGMDGLGQALARMSGTVVADRWRLESLYATGAEGAVFLCRDVDDPSSPTRVAKMALLPYHRPFELSFAAVRAARARLREEARRLAKSGSRYMPEFLGLHEFANPLLDPERGGEFERPEPVFVMERLPGFDLDAWLARVHSSRVPLAIVRRNVDHVAVVVLRGIWDLHERGYFYCDLRPGNVRIRGRSEHRVRLMDAGSLVPRDAPAGEFPHVPAYLPPDLFLRAESLGPETLVPTLAVQAVMAGRTLFEVATGRVPVPGEPVDASLLRRGTASPAVATAIARLCVGDFPDVLHALHFLAKATSRRRTTSKPAPNPSRDPPPEPASSPVLRPAVVGARRDLAAALVAARSMFTPATPSSPEPRAASSRAAPRRAWADADILPPSRNAKPWWRRLVERLARP